MYYVDIVRNMIFFQADVQRTVKARLVDNSSNVREATIDLIGKYILTRPDLIEKYFDMIGERIRVITFLICSPF